MPRQVSTDPKPKYKTVKIGISDLDHRRFRICAAARRLSNNNYAVRAVERQVEMDLAAMGLKRTLGGDTLEEISDVIKRS